LEGFKIDFEKDFPEGFIKINASEMSADWLEKIHQPSKNILNIQSTSGNPVEEWRNIFMNLD